MDDIQKLENNQDTTLMQPSGQETVVDQVRIRREQAIPIRKNIVSVQ